MKTTLHYPYLTFMIEQSQTIDEFFQSLHLSKKTIHLLKQNKDYKVGKSYVPSHTLLEPGQRLTIKAYEQDDGMYVPRFEPLDVVYEDDYILIVNKPPFLQVFPDDQAKTDSLAHLVSGYYHQNGYNLPVRYIHRLDYETSGLVFFCKCALLQPLLDYQLSIKAIHRDYLAIVEGTLPLHKKNKINKPIGRDRHHNQKMIIAPAGKEACTYYTCLHTKNHLSLVHCTLTTGRKHQIRVHMASIGHPILGDQLYGHPSVKINHQALHAYQLIFIHPITQKKMTITCPPPQDMQKIITSLQK